KNLNDNHCTKYYSSTCIGRSYVQCSPVPESNFFWCFLYLHHILFHWRFSNWKKTKGTSISLGTMFWNWLFSNFIYFFNHAWKQYYRKSVSYSFCSTCLRSKWHGWRHNWLIKQTFQLDIFYIHL